MLNKQLVNLLADGRVHRFEQLVAQLGIDGASLLRDINHLKDLGVAVEIMPKLSCQITNGLELLDQAEILAYVDAAIAPQISKFDIIDVVASTNDYLLNTVTHQASSGAICLAEQQTHGRGRLGRNWCSPFAANIYLSILWQFPKSTPNIAALSLAVGVGVVKALTNYGIKDGLGLKWPNDVVYREGKLAGILLEISPKVQNCYQVVAGIGLNVAMPKKSAADIDQPWQDIQQIIANRPQRNRLVGLLINELLSVFALYRQHGFDYFLPEWRQHDIAINQPVTVSTSTQQLLGTVHGINRAGELVLLDEHGHTRNINIGEVSLRMKNS